MLFEIIRHTPKWVFALFFVLLIVGYLQTKRRTVKLKTVFILPISMIILSVFGVASAFGAMPIAFAAWFIAGLFALAIVLKWRPTQGISYARAEKIFFVPGSWAPLFLMMAIFSTKYIVGAAIAQQLPIISDINFIALVSLLYGCFSGIFLSRSIGIWQVKKASS